MRTCLSDEVSLARSCCRRRLTDRLEDVFFHNSCTVIDGLDHLFEMIRCMVLDEVALRAVSECFPDEIIIMNMFFL